MYSPARATVSRRCHPSPAKQDDHLSRARHLLHLNRSWAIQCTKIRAYCIYPYHSLVYTLTNALFAVVCPVQLADPAAVFPVASTCCGTMILSTGHEICIGSESKARQPTAISVNLQTINSGPKAEAALGSIHLIDKVRSRPC